MVFYQISFVISPGLLYHLIRRDSGRLANEAFTSNPTVCSKEWFNGLKITNWKDRRAHWVKTNSNVWYEWQRVTTSSSANDEWQWVTTIDNDWHRWTSDTVWERMKTRKHGLNAYNFIKKWLQHRCFPLNFAKFLRTPILYNNCERLLLESK